MEDSHIPTFWLLLYVESLLEFYAPRHSRVFHNCSGLTQSAGEVLPANYSDPPDCRRGLGAFS